MYSLWTLWLTALLGKATNARIKKPQDEKQDMNDANIPSHISCCFSISCQTCSSFLIHLKPCWWMCLSHLRVQEQCCIAKLASWMFYHCFNGILAASRSAESDVESVSHTP